MKCIFITNQRSLQSYKIIIKELGNKSERKNLGIKVNENLRFSNHIRDEVSTANQSMGLIRRLWCNQINLT